MSQENVEIVRVGFDAFMRGDVPSMLDFFAPDVVVTLRPDQPDVRDYHGHPGQDGLRAAWRDWLAPWASYRTEIEELIDLEEHVVAVVRDYGRTRPRSDSKAAAVWTLRDGRVVRAEFYPSGPCRGAGVSRAGRVARAARHAEP